jgi:MoxR-like ATPase
VLALLLGTEFRRIQFTPDLMPSDLVGTTVFNPQTATFSLRQGPVFTNILLADEINRTPPKTQSALLEAMQERSVSHAGVTRLLPQPFFVLATQNPIEQAGTYPLPEAQLDRFLLFLRVGYPKPDEEARIITATTSGPTPSVEPVFGGEDLLGLQDLVRQVHISPTLVDYATAVVRATRPVDSPLATVREAVEWGAGPRGGQALVVCAKARALLRGDLAVALTDLRALAPPVLRHRVLLNFRAQAERRDVDEVIAAVLAGIDAPRSPLA